jgi:hypothetical protein
MNAKGLTEKRKLPGNRKKEEEIEFLPKFRVASFIEKENNLVVTGELIPMYPSGFPTSEDPELKNKLLKLYDKHRDWLLNRMALSIRDLALEVWAVSEKPERVDSLRELKFRILSDETDYTSEYLKLDIEATFSPTVIPVFESEFDHKGIIYQEDLKF